MSVTENVSFGLAVIAAGLSLGMAFLTARMRIALSSANTERDRALVAEAATMRVLRLSVTDIRADAMRLLGHAEQVRVSSEASQDLDGILALIRQILLLTDDMQDHAVPGASTRRLYLVTLQLGPLITDAIEAVNATLGPSQRHWRVSDAVGRCALIADQRAVAQVIGRVLSNAARHSRNGDWIDISVDQRNDGLALIIEDEGAGLIAPQRPSDASAPDSRGLGLGLVLARVLMEAHGGSMAVDSATRVGTRVTLTFPAERVSSADQATIVRLAA
ncbi:MAG: sensor histidine kinase [Acetobacteraceae bacterium]